MPKQRASPNKQIFNPLFSIHYFQSTVRCFTVKRARVVFYRQIITQGVTDVLFDLGQVKLGQETRGEALLPDSSSVRLLNLHKLYNSILNLIS